MKWKPTEICMLFGSGILVIIGLLLIAAGKILTVSGMLSNHSPKPQPIPPVAMKFEDHPQFSVTEEEQKSILVIAAKIRDTHLIPWEMENVERLKLPFPVGDEMKAVLLPPYPEELVNKCRRDFEKKFVHSFGDRASKVLQPALEEWMSICRFSDQWQIMSLETTGAFYHEKFNDRSQITPRIGGGYAMKRDETTHQPSYLLPNYSPLVVDLSERYGHLFK